MRKKGKAAFCKKENIGSLVCIALGVAVCAACVGTDILKSMSGIQPPEALSDVVSNFDNIRKSADEAADEVKNFINEDDIKNAVSELEKDIADESQEDIFADFEKGNIVKKIDDVTYLVNLNGEEKKVILAGIDSFYDDVNVVGDSSKWTDVFEAVEEKTRPGTVVYIEYDDTISKIYDSGYAYIYTQDGIMIQEWLLANGYSAVSEYPPNLKYIDSFSQLSEIARKNEVGLWSEIE